MSHRPYSGHSIAELEELAEAATTVAGLDLLANELRHRRTHRARELADHVSARLARLRGQASSDRVSAAAPKSAASRPMPARRAPRVNTGSTFPPTDEQITARDLFASGRSLKISAFAGTGKTSTLKLMAHARGGHGLYLAFNRAIANEAKQDFPSSVESKTTHALALRGIRRTHSFDNQKLFNNINANQVAEILDLKKIKGPENIIIEPRQQAFLRQKTVQLFCQSSASEISVDHVPLTGKLRRLSTENQEKTRQWVRKGAIELWQRMLAPNDPIPLGHDGYLKLWTLDEPTLAFDYILLDEAQDTNGAVLGTLLKQQTQLIFVGDRHQQIYEWRGAVNAMEKISTDAEAFLTQSFRFGPEIAEAASGLLRALGETRRLRGNDAITSTIADSGETRTVLARTNATVIEETLAALEAERKPLVVGGTAELERLVSDVFELMKGNPGNHPDFFGFKNWEEVVAFAETEEGESLQTFVSLVQKNGPKRLWVAIKSAVSDESLADVVISTAHKAKGCQWPSVRIASDFAITPSKKKPAAESGAAESRLFYVAITRPRELLAVEPVVLQSFTNGAIHAGKHRRAVADVGPEPTIRRHRPPEQSRPAAVEVGSAQMEWPFERERRPPDREPKPKPTERRGFFSRWFS
jgi:superfamily I DNA/RNA helicase